MRREEQFEVFGRKYKVKEFSAVHGMMLLDDANNVHPEDMLSDCKVILDGVEISLNWRNINAYVIDEAGVIPPLLVLKSVITKVDKFNYGFLSDWKSVKVPGRFRGAQSEIPKHVPNMFSDLMQNGLATLKELETYYSLRDAFSMFDALVTKTLNEALAQEAAAKAAKSSR